MIPAIVGGIATIGSALGSYLGQASANKSNRQIAREQMAFQERMSSTAYQRRLMDLRKAGINPMLALSSGAASSPGGAGATMQDAVGPAIGTALSVVRARKELKLLDAQIAKTKQDARVSGYNADIIGASPTGGKFGDGPVMPFGVHILKKQLENLSTTGRQMNVGLEILKHQVPQAEWQSKSVIAFLRSIFGNIPLGAVLGAGKR